MERETNFSKKIENIFSLKEKNKRHLRNLSLLDNTRYHGKFYIAGHPVIKK